MSELSEDDDPIEVEDRKWGRAGYTKFDRSTRITPASHAECRATQTMSYLLYHARTAEDAKRMRDETWYTEGFRRLLKQETREEIDEHYREASGFVIDPWVHTMHPAVYAEGVPLSRKDHSGPNTVVLPMRTDQLNVYNSLLRSSSSEFDLCRERTLGSEMSMKAYTAKRLRCHAEHMWMDRNGEIWPDSLSPLDGDDRYVAAVYIHSDAIGAEAFLPDEELPDIMKTETLVLV